MVDVRNFFKFVIPFLIHSFAAQWKQNQFRTFIIKQTIENIKEPHWGVYFGLIYKTTFGLQRKCFMGFSAPKLMPENIALITI